VAPGPAVKFQVKRLAAHRNSTRTVSRSRGRVNAPHPWRPRRGRSAVSS
jgi:hypothetical protein